MHSDSEHCWGQSLRDSLPVLVGYVPLGMVFGFFALQAGMPGWAVIGSSVFVYAGASQFMMVPMAMAGMSIPLIVFATFVVNLRHVFYSLALLNRFPSHGICRWYSIYALTDETFSLIVGLPRDASGKRIATLSFLNQCWWVLGTVFGVAFGQIAQLSLVGVDFILCCLFAMLGTEQFRAKRSWVPVAVAAIAYAVSRILDPGNPLLWAICLCVAFCLIWNRRQAKEHVHA